MVGDSRGSIEIAKKESTILDDLSLKPKDYYLATVHRAESTDEFIRLKSIVDAFANLGI